MKGLKEILNAVGSTADWYLRGAPRDVNQKNAVGDTALHVACRWGDVDAVNTLINSAANVNARGEFGMTPLFDAISSNANIKIVKLLLNAGANPLIEAEGIFKGQTVLYSAQINEEISNHEALIELLRKAVFEAENSSKK